MIHSPEGFFYSSLFAQLFSCSRKWLDQAIKDWKWYYRSTEIWGKGRCRSDYGCQLIKNVNNLIT